MMLTLRQEIDNTWGRRSPIPANLTLAGGPHAHEDKDKRRLLSKMDDTPAAIIIQGGSMAGDHSTSSKDVPLEQTPLISYPGVADDNAQVIASYDSCVSVNDYPQCHFVLGLGDSASGSHMQDDETPIASKSMANVTAITMDDSYYDHLPSDVEDGLHTVDLMDTSLPVVLGDVVRGDDGSNITGGPYSILHHWVSGYHYLDIASYDVVSVQITVVSILTIPVAVGPHDSGSDNFGKLSGIMTVTIIMDEGAYFALSAIHDPNSPQIIYIPAPGRLVPISVGSSNQDGNQVLNSPHHSVVADTLLGHYWRTVLAYSDGYQVVNIAKLETPGVTPHAVDGVDGYNCLVYTRGPGHFMIGSNGGTLHHYAVVAAFVGDCFQMAHMISAQSLAYITSSNSNDGAFHSRGRPFDIAVQTMVHQDDCTNITSYMAVAPSSDKSPIFDERIGTFVNGVVTHVIPISERDWLAAFCQVD